MSVNPTELEVLKQRIIELEAENAEIPDLRRKISEFDAERVDLRRKLSVSDAEIAELKRSNIEFLRANKEYNERRDAENAKLRAGIVELKSENAELRDRVTKVEQKQTLQSALTANDNSSNNSSPSFNSVAVPEAITVLTNSAKHLNGKPLEEKDMDSFLLEAHKKIVSSEIKQRNKEKKNEKNGQGLIQEISSSVPKENHVTKISETARSRKSDNSDALVSSFHGTSMIELSQHLAQLCDKALIAEEHRLEANQEEIFCWYHYGRNFVFQLEALCDKNKIGEKKARGLIYDEVVKQVNILRKKRSQDTGVPLPDITRDGLRKKTQRSEKIYKLLEKIGLDKIQYIKSYSANEISKFTNDEIQKIMDHFSNKPSTDFSEDWDNFINDDSSSQTDTSEVRANPLVSAGVSISTAPIPLSHDSNSSGDSSKISPVNSPKDKVSTSSITSTSQINESNQSRLPISILPEDPEEKRKHIIGLVLEKFPYLSLDDSDERRDTFNLDGSTLCPLCNGDHKVNRSIFDEIKGEWGDGEYYGERTYRLNCRVSYKPGIPVVSVKA